MSSVRLDEGRELLWSSGGFVCVADRFYPFTGFLDGTATIGFTEIEVKGTGRDQCSDIGSVSMFVNSGDEIGKTVQQFRAVDTRVGR